MITFNPIGSWLDNLDSGLLYRYWVSKGCPGVLTTRAYGLTVKHVKCGHGVVKTVDGIHMRAPMMTGKG